MKLMTRYRSIRRTRAGRCRAGFSLLEVIAAVVIMAITFFGIYAMVIQSLRIVEQNRMTLRAQHAMHSQLEALNATDWSSLATMAQSSAMSPSEIPVMNEIPQSQGSRIVTPFPSTTNQSDMVRAASVVVEWQGMRATSQTNSMTTLITVW